MIKIYQIILYGVLVAIRVRTGKSKLFRVILAFFRQLYSHAYILNGAACE